MGWILCGVLNQSKSKQINPVCLVTTTDEIGGLMKKVWEIEELPNKTHYTEEELMCIDHYEEHTKRSEDGKYIVSMPLKDNINELGDSRKNALAQLLHQERRFDKYPQLKNRYIDFINEYISMGHMVLCTEAKPERVYYLPHHAVFKQSTTTKLRVVFDTSRKTTSGLSLNDCMMNGPRLQDDLFNIMLRFRLYRNAFTAGIAKMSSN